MTSRRAVAALAATAVLGVGAGAANAAKPLRGPAATADPVTFPAGAVCPFELYVETVENRQTETIFDDGTVVYTGFNSTRLVNTETGTELTLVSQGAVRLSPAGANLRISITGPIIFLFFPGDAGPGDPGTGRAYYFHGKTSGVVDAATFTGLSFEHSGKATDLCAALG